MKYIYFWFSVSTEKISVSHPPKLIFNLFEIDKVCHVRTTIFFEKTSYNMKLKTGLKSDEKN